MVVVFLRCSNEPFSLLCTAFPFISPFVLSLLEPASHVYLSFSSPSFLPSTGCLRHLNSQSLCSLFLVLFYSLLRRLHRSFSLLSFPFCYRRLISQSLHSLLFSSCYCFIDSYFLSRSFIFSSYLLFFTLLPRLGFVSSLKTYTFFLLTYSHCIISL